MQRLRLTNVPSFSNHVQFHTLKMRVICKPHADNQFFGIRRTSLLSTTLEVTTTTYGTSREAFPLFDERPRRTRRNADPVNSTNGSCKRSLCDCPLRKFSGLSAGMQNLRKLPRSQTVRTRLNSSMSDELLSIGQRPTIARSAGAALASEEGAGVPFRCVS